MFLARFLNFSLVDVARGLLFSSKKDFIKHLPTVGAFVVVVVALVVVGFSVVGASVVVASVVVASVVVASVVVGVNVVVNESVVVLSAMKEFRTLSSIFMPNLRH